MTQPYIMTQPEIWGYDYTRVRSTGSVNYDSFEFNVNVSESERWISPKNSYLSIRLRIVQTDEAGVAGLLAPIVNIGASKTGATICSIPYSQSWCCIIFCNLI